jgi:Uma2 family endonuclease
MSGMLVLDQRLVDEFMAQRANDPRAEFDECWEGRIVVPPCPNNEHYLMQMRLAEACSAVIDWDAGDQAVPGGNVTDRDDGWMQNYRNPDLLVALAGGRAIDRGPYWLGGPDLVAEVISPGEEPHAKFDFYAAVGCREVLVLDRDPWAVELYRLTDGVLKLVGRSALPDSTPVASSVLPLVFQLVPAADRPRVQVTHPASGRVIRA